MCPQTTSWMQRTVVLCLVVGLCGRWSVNSLPAVEPDRPPNIVLLIADDLGYGELGCQGNLEIPTPHIDALAQSGIRCTQAYVTAPNCSPSRAGLFSGRIPTRFGYEFNPIGARNEDPGTGLPRSETTLAEVLHDHGYTTGLIGKWHLGGAADFHPQRHGFDEFFGFLHEGHYYLPPPWKGATTMLRRKGLPWDHKGRYWINDAVIASSHMGHDEPPYDADNPILRGGSPVVEQEYLTDALTREATDFIERYQNSPFFLTVSYNAVHSPLQAKTKTLASLSHIEDIHRRIFAAMLVDMDTGVGEVIATLAKRGLRERTLVIFLSDNGGPTRELTSSNLPLRGGKGSMYEGGLRVPFIVSWPQRLPAGGTSDAVVSSLDILPTCTEVAGIAPPSGLDGRNLLESLIPEGDSRSAPRSLFWRQGARAALRRDNWKIVSPRRDQESRIWELYDLDRDIGETNNLATAREDVLQRMQQRWEKFDAEMMPPLF